MSNTNTLPLRPSLGVIIIYALGQLGWSLTSYTVSNQLSYFFMPPEDGQGAIFPAFIFQGAILGILTLVGITGFGGRIFDAITDPLIANYSDKVSSTFGKRKKLMAIAALPFALFSFFVFYPLTHEVSSLNGIWLLICTFLFFLFMTIYVVPYTALISELGHHPKDRLKISTIISITWALGFVIGSQVFLFQGMLEESMGAVNAFQATVGAYAILGFILMMIPVFFLKENKYCMQGVTNQDVLSAVLSVFKNKNFTFFAISDLMYWLSLTFIQLGVSYYVTTLFGFEKEQAAFFLFLGFVVSFLLYAPINILANRFGKKKIIISAFIVFSLLFALTSSLDILPLSKDLMFYLLAILSAYPLACFGIIPNAIIADIVYEHEESTGQQQSAMFFGARNFMMKLGISLANLIFPSLLLLGKSIDNPLGVRVSAICAVVFCIIGFIVFLNYKEQRTNSSNV